jgi:hypothetical protein
MPENDFLPANAAASIAMIHRVARRLGDDLLGQVVFLGGATLALLLTDPAVSEVRPTNDVDVIIEVLTYRHYIAISEELRQKGFREDTSPGAPICRWEKERCGRQFPVSYPPYLRRKPPEFA